MTEDLIPELICIADDGELDLSRVEQRTGENVDTGKLRCRRCGRPYEIRQGVVCMMDVSNEPKSHFGAQWNWFLQGRFENPAESTYGEDRDFILRDFFAMTNLTPATLAGRRILDAGSGSGKLSYHLMRTFPDIPFEIVNLEITDSIYAASQWVNDGRAKFVRGSVLQPGLRRSSFDVVYSAGVLHHTSNPRLSFAALSRLVKPGGTMSTWMYSKRFNPFLDTTGIVWPLTRHLPTSVIFAIAWMLSPFYWLLFRGGYAFKTIFRPRSWRWNWVMPLSFGSIRLHLFDYMHTYYRFRYWPEEIVPWYKENGFEEIVIVRPGSTAMHARRAMAIRTEAPAVAAASEM